MGVKVLDLCEYRLQGVPNGPWLALLQHELTDIKLRLSAKRMRIAHDVNRRVQRVAAIKKSVQHSRISKSFLSKRCYVSSDAVFRAKPDPLACLCTRSPNLTHEIGPAEERLLCRDSRMHALAL